MKHLAVFTLLCALSGLGSPTAAAHTPSAIQTFKQEWLASVDNVGGLTVALVGDYLEFMARHRPPILLPAEPRPRTQAGVEQWRSLVSKYFAPEDVEMALRIMACESGGNPLAKNRTSTASGLFQHLKGWWSGSWGVTGPFDPFNPEESIRAGAALRYAHGGWRDWDASRACWG